MQYYAWHSLPAEVQYLSVQYASNHSTRPPSLVSLPDSLTPQHDLLYQVYLIA